MFDNLDPQDQNGKEENYSSQSQPSQNFNSEDNSEAKKTNSENGSNLGKVLNENQGSGKQQTDSGQKNASEPEDMFASVDSGNPNLKNRNQQAAQNFNQAVAQATPENASPQAEKGKSLALKPSKKEAVVWIVLFLIVVAIMVGGFYWISSVLSNPEEGYGDKNNSGAVVNEESENQNEENQSTNQGNKEENKQTPEDAEKEKEKETPPQDSDGDGLSDEQEKEIGTDINQADTDGDGLTDREEFMGTKTSSFKKDTDGDGLTDFEELKEYGTDPATPDSDGDGYTDGEEVENGYNPLGEGKL